MVEKKERSDFGVFIHFIFVEVGTLLVSFILLSFVFGFLGYKGIKGFIDYEYQQVPKTYDITVADDAEQLLHVANPLKLKDTTLKGHYFRVDSYSANGIKVHHYKADQRGGLVLTGTDFIPDIKSDNFRYTFNPILAQVKGDNDKLFVIYETNHSTTLIFLLFFGVIVVCAVSLWLSKIINEKIRAAFPE